MVEVLLGVDDGERDLPLEQDRPEFHSGVAAADDDDVSLRQLLGRQLATHDPVSEPTNLENKR